VFTSFTLSLLLQCCQGRSLQPRFWSNRVKRRTWRRKRGNCLPPFGFCIPCAWWNYHDLQALMNSPLAHHGEFAADLLCLGLVLSCCGCCCWSVMFSPGAFVLLQCTNGPWCWSVILVPAIYCVCSWLRDAFECSTNQAILHTYFESASESRHLMLLARCHFRPIK